jgi:hypothetical protein
MRKSIWLFPALALVIALLAMPLSVSVKKLFAYDIGPEPYSMQNKLAHDIGPEPDSVQRIFAHEVGPRSTLIIKRV